MISLFPIRTQINNGILSANRAMPQKALTSNNENQFALDRNQYAETVNNTTTVKQYAQKKWIGGNRDASQVAMRQRVNAVGNGSLNAAKKPMSFETIADNNTARQAVQRARSGGAVVPAKKTSKHAGAAIFY